MNFVRWPVLWQPSIAVVASIGTLAGVALPACAQVQPGQSVEASRPEPFKLTLGSYSVAGGDLPAGPGLDVNLRYTYGQGNV